MTYVVIVSDTDIMSPSTDPAGVESVGTIDEVEVIGPFITEQAALDWAWMEQRWLVAVKRITSRSPS